MPGIFSTYQPQAWLGKEIRARAGGRCIEREAVFGTVFLSRGLIWTLPGLLSDVSYQTKRGNHLPHRRYS